MKFLLRRNFLKLAGAFIATPALPRLASALDYPTRPTKIVAGFAAGGGVDITARLIGQWLADDLGQPFVVENRTGAGGNIGTEAVVNAAPDGNTLLLATVPNAVNASLYEKLSFNFVRDIAPVAGVIRVPMVVLVHPSVPAQTLPEFIAYAKAKTGKLRALAVTTAARMAELPEIPTVGDSVPGYEASQWYGFAAPKNTPAEIVEKLNKEINAAIADPGMKAKLAAIGGAPMSGSPADFGKLIADETEKWGKVVRTGDLKPE